MLDDQISQKNTHEEQERQKKKKHEEEYSEKGIRRKLIYIKLFGVAAGLTLIPFVLSFGAKLRKER